MTTAVAPIVEKARDLSRTVLAGLPRRWRHSAGVAGRAERLAAHLLTDAEERALLVATAWLHDIGYADPVVDTGFHPLDGAAYLRRSGWPERITGLVAYHSGAVFVARARGLAEALLAYPDERSVLADALTYADQTTGPDGEPRHPEERMAEMLRRHGPGSVNALVHARRAPYLRATVSRVDARLRARHAGQAKSNNSGKASTTAQAQAAYTTT